MKRVITLFLLAALLLAGCAGKKITVDYEEHTISDGKYTYQYTDESTIHNRTIRIVYPNGGIYRWEEHYSERNSYSYGNGNELYDPVEYALGEDLVDAILAPEQEPQDPYEFEVIWPMILTGALLIGYGICLVVSPYTHWKWRYGIMFDNAQPSDEAIGQFMALGYLNIAIGVIAILIGIFAG